ncbi:MAG: hypothetical protein AAGA23_04550 [Pseudomonadota bacterium]
MAAKGLSITDRLVQEELGGSADAGGAVWTIPRRSAGAVSRGVEP